MPTILLLDIWWQGIEHYVQVDTLTASPCSRTSAWSDLVVGIPMRKPSAPLDFAVETALRIYEVQQVTIAAREVEEVQVILATASVVPQMQTIRTSGSAAGSFVVKVTSAYAATTPATFAYDASADAIKVW
jgi:hypothetical protein